MLRSRSNQTAHELPADVLLSVQGVSRIAVSQLPEIPNWLRRVLPKSGIAGQTMVAPDDEDEEDDEDALDEEDDYLAEPLTLNEISFDVRAGEGVGILGPDAGAREALLQILFGGIPPTTGRVLVRGRVAPLLRDISRYTGKTEWGKDAVFLAARFLNWPRALLSERWDEILEFARLEDVSGAKYHQRVTLRLLFASVLHMDASVYVLDGGIDFDPDFALRCVDLLEQRQREGAVVVQGAQKMIEDVSRLCGEVIWIEKDGTMIRGRPVDVAIEVQKRQLDEVHPLSAPILAWLHRPDRALEVPGTVEIELHLLRKGLEFRFTAELTDDRGGSVELEQSELFTSERPGLAHLHIRIPAGRVPDGTYRGKLMAEMGIVGSPPAAPRQLLEFELVSMSKGLEPAHADAVTFELVLKDEPVQLATAETEPEPSVRRAVS